jgi:putative sigma-54 modulation protein
MQIELFFRILNIFWHNNGDYIEKIIQMDIIIQSLGFKAGDVLQNFIRERIKNLKTDDIVRANVVLYKGPSGNPQSDYCEIRLEVPGNDHFVKKHSADFETAVLGCVEVLTQMIQKIKEKQIDSRQGDATIIQNNSMEEEEDDDVELEDVVK